MHFNKTKKELKNIKKIPILPILSYCSVLFLIGFTLKEISQFGNISYFIAVVLLPLFFTAMGSLTGENLLKAFREDWLALPFLVHILIIINCLIIYNLIKTIILKELWVKRILNK